MAVALLVVVAAVVGKKRSRQFESVFYTDSIVICDCGRQPAILVWFVYQFLQFDWPKIKDL